MRGTGIYHPLFSTHPRNGIASSMTDELRIYKPTGARSAWTPGPNGGTIVNDAYELIYEGMGRVQPNLDWRARDRNFAAEPTGTQTIRVQIPIRGNRLTDDKTVPLIAKDYLVVPFNIPEEERGWLLGAPIIVRNATQASQHWLRSMIADIGTRPSQANG